MMVLFDIDAGLHHLDGNFGADIMHLVGRRDREITFFMARAVAQVGFGGIAGIPDTFLRINVIETLMAVGLEGNTVEDEEFQLRSPVTDIGDAGGS